MGKLITVSMSCQHDATRQTFEEFVSRRRDYLITKGQGTGACDMLLLELNEFRPQQTFGHIRELLGTDPDLEIFLTASRTDPQVLLEAFRLGVKEFLPQPLTHQEVDQALGRFEERFKGRAAAAEHKSGRVICVLGARGGVGTSTVATNLAISLQQARRADSIALVDLDCHGGDLGLFLDLSGDRGIKHLSKDVSRLDETILRSAFQQHASGLQLLASGHDQLDDVHVAPGSTMRIIGLLRSMHQHVFVDCGHILEPPVKEALDSAEQVIIVTTLALPAIRRTKRMLDVLRGAYPPHKMHVVVNRYEKDQKDVLIHAEELLSVKMSGLIPNDYTTASEAMNHGKPLTLTASRKAISQWYLHGRGLLVGDKSEANGAGSPADKTKKATFLGRCFSSLGIDVVRKASMVSRG